MFSSSLWAWGIFDETVHNSRQPLSRNSLTPVKTAVYLFLRSVYTNS